MTSWTVVQETLIVEHDPATRTPVDRGAVLTAVVAQITLNGTVQAVITEGALPGACPEFDAAGWITDEGDARSRWRMFPARQASPDSPDRSNRDTSWDRSVPRNPANPGSSETGRASKPDRDPDRAETDPRHGAVRTAATARPARACCPRPGLPPPQERGGPGAPEL